MARVRKILVSLTILLLVLLGGCGRPKPAPSGEQSLVIGAGRDFYAGEQSPGFAHGSTGIWESLTVLNEDLEPVPHLAEKLVPDDTGKVWTVHLRPGIKFHDGTPLDARAVVESVRRISRHPKLDEYGTFAQLERVEAVGEREVRFVFRRPEPAFPAKVAYHGCPIFSPQSFDAEGKILHPYGTGPFKFAEYKKGEALTVVRNDDYWRGRPRLEKVTFKVIPDPSTRLAALQTGAIQAIADVGGVLPEQAPIIQGDPRLVLLSRPVTTTHYLLFNNQKPPFNDVRLRQAVSLTVDRQQLVKEVLGGYGEPADTLFTPLARRWVVKGLWTTDKQKARELAEQAKGKEPRKVLLVVNSSLANRWPYRSLAEVLQAELKELGFEVELKLLEMGAWKEALKRGEYDLTLTPYTLMTGDPDFFFGRWIYSRGSMNRERGLGYRNPEADRLVEQAAAELDPARRKELYDRLQRLVAEEVPLCPLYHDLCLYATRKEVQGLTLDPFFKPSLERTWIE
ncbi:ABC transporter substrate-binding protein [Desulfothermobacter acidiphilus]|uniref:ABC transporter substrate-binding protein n=1 Tax=Desulfothermobacter acidiphilus TaxID=1938353 RepID=UPI003F88CCE8